MRKKSAKSTVTLKDIAQKAGVSHMTVSRALKQNSSVSVKTRQHVMKFVEKMQYVPDLTASSLTTGKSGFIGLIIPSLNNLHFAKTVQSLTEEVEALGFQILLGYSNYSPQKEERIIETMLRRRPEALVLSYDGHTDRTIKLLKNEQTPVIEIWEIPAQPIQHTVGFSNHNAAYDMTKALIKRGFREIVFLSEQHDAWTRGAARRQGFSEAMREAGRNSHAHIRLGKPPLSIEDGAAAATEILQKFPQVDCIFCVSDMAAFGVQSRLLQMGIKIPEMISIIGFGNFEVSQFSSPTISTVIVDPHRIGKDAGSILTKILSDNASSSFETQHIITPTWAEFRESAR